MPEEKNNGQKTEAQLSEERLERYKKEPDSFIEVKPEIIVCVIRTPKGPMIYIGGNKPELQVAFTELHMRIPGAIQKLDIESAIKNKKLVHVPGSFLGGVRGLKKKK